MNERPIDPFGVPENFTDAPPQIEHHGGMVFLTFTRRTDGDNIVRARLLMTQEVFEAMREKIRADLVDSRIRYEAAGCAGRC